jgi:pyruvate dehydrogenase E2 component (dihydrolipoamide acetyltransferase)
VRVEEPTAAERTVARRAAESRATVPSIELAVEVEMAPSLDLRERHASSITALLVRASALALRDHPRANGSYRDGHFELYSRINVGIVVAAEGVYAIPTLFDADQKPLDAVTEEIEELVAGAKAGRLTSPAFSGATFTLWNAGALGVDQANIPVVAPQSAALAAGAIRETVVLGEGELIGSRPMTLTLSCDHRILYGARAAGFLDAVRSWLERGEP